MLYHVMVKPLFIRGSHLLHYQGANTDGLGGTGEEDRIKTGVINLVKTLSSFLFLLFHEISILRNKITLSKNMKNSTHTKKIQQDPARAPTLKKDSNSLFFCKLP